MNYNDGRNVKRKLNNKKNKESTKLPYSPSWTSTTFRGTNFTPRTGHAVTHYDSTNKNNLEYKCYAAQRIAFLSCQSASNSHCSTAVFLPDGVNKLICSFIELELSKKIFVFGGTSNTERLNDSYVIDIVRGESSAVSISGPIPNKRSGAKAQVVNGHVYIFGGYDGRGGSYYNDIWAIDLRLGQEWKLLTDPTSMWRPSPRTDHTMVAFKNRFLVIFGGYDGIVRYNDVSVYDCNFQVWNQVKAKGDIPTKRFGQTAEVFGDCMYIYGGWDGFNTLSETYCFNIMTAVWTKIKANGPIPPHRYRHISVILKHNMYIFGGVDQDHRRYNDLQCFNVLTHTWSQITVSGDTSSRSFHSAVNFSNTLLILGGFDGVERLSNIVECELPSASLHGLEPEQEQIVLPEDEDVEMTDIEFDLEDDL